MVFFIVLYNRQAVKFLTMDEYEKSAVRKSLQPSIFDLLETIVIKTNNKTYVQNRTIKIKK